MPGLALIGLIVKLLKNILLNPVALKYRQINTETPHIKEILTDPDSASLLNSIGFHLEGVHYRYKATFSIEQLVELFIFFYNTENPIEYRYGNCEIMGERETMEDAIFIEELLNFKLFFVYD